MTIKFADPGFDWTPFIVDCAVVGGLLLISALCLLGYRLRSSKLSILDDVSFGFLLAAGVWAILGTVVCGMMSSTAYSHRVNVALYQALEDAGFDQIEMSLDRDGNRDTRALTGTFDGKPFSGTITNLNYPSDFAYKIEETE